MPKKEDIQARTLTKTFPPQVVIIDGSDNITLYENSGWTATTLTISGTNYGLCYRIDDFDLSGYTLQEQTLYPQGVLMQDMGYGPVGSTVPNIQRATLVTTTPLSVSDLSNLSGAGAIWNLPGSDGSTFMMQHIIQGRLEFYLAMTNYSAAIDILQKTTTWGAGDSTAAPKMWICEAYLWPLTGQAGDIIIPASAIVMPCLIGKEPDLEYLMRLSRSLEPVY